MVWWKEFQSVSFILTAGKGGNLWCHEKYHEWCWNCSRGRHFWMPDVCLLIHSFFIFFYFLRKRIAYLCLSWEV